MEERREKRRRDEETTCFLPFQKLTKLLLVHVESGSGARYTGCPVGGSKMFIENVPQLPAVLLSVGERVVGEAGAWFRSRGDATVATFELFGRVGMPPVPLAMMYPGHPSPGRFTALKQRPEGAWALPLGKRARCWRTPPTWRVFQRAGGGPQS